MQIWISWLQSQLIWIYTVCKGRVYPGSAGQGLICSFIRTSTVRSYGVQIFRVNMLTLVLLNKLRCHIHFLIFSQSDYLIQVVDVNSLTKWQTVQIQISWLLQNPIDLDLHCLQRQDISGSSRIPLLLLNTTCPVLANSVDPDQLASEEAN